MGRLIGQFAGVPLLMQFAEQEGIAERTDLVALSGLKPNIIYRYWADPDWLNKIRNENVRALAAVLPALAIYMSEYMSIQPDAELAAAKSALGQDGVEVRRNVLDWMQNDQGMRSADIAAALRAAHKLLRCESDDDLLGIHRDISPLWEKQRGRCFECLMPSDPEHSLISEPNDLVAQAARLRDLLLARKPTKLASLRVV